MELLLRRGRRSARAQGFFIDVLHEEFFRVGRASAASSTPPSSSALPHVPLLLGHRDLLHEPTPAPRTASRTTVPLPWAAQQVDPCGHATPQGEGRGLHLGHQGEPARRTPSTLQASAAGTASPAPRRRCAGRSRLHAWSSISAMFSDCLPAPAGASSRWTVLWTRRTMQDRPRRGVRPEDHEEGGREEHETLTIIHHLGIMGMNLGSDVGVAERCLVPCFATTPTALRGGGRRDVGIAVAALRFVAAFARTPIPSQPSEKKPVIVGVLEPSWLAGFARTSTVAEGSKAEARSSGVADYPLAAGFATTPLHLGPSASMPLGSTTSPGMWVAGVALFLFGPTF